MADPTDEAPRLNRRQQAKARTRQRVLDAAQGLFVQPAGYEVGTIRQIAKVAGMSTGAVFANFDSKADLYRAIYGHAPIGVADAHRLARLLVGFLETGGDVFTTERVLDEVVPEWRDLPEPGIRPEPADLGLPRDVVELVLAARAVAFADGPPDDADLKRLDSASEAFASRVPWDDEPEGAA